MELKPVNFDYNNAGRAAAQECVGSIYLMPCAHAPVVPKDLVQQPLCLLPRPDFRQWE